MAEAGGLSVHASSVASSAFPDAAYFIIASRLRPGLDGGYTVAALRRALDFERYGGVVPTILTVEFCPDYDLVRDEFITVGLATPRTVIRNLYGDFRVNPGLLRAAARALGVSRPVAAPVPGSTGSNETIDLDAAGRPWKITVSNVGGATQYTDFLDTAGRRLLRLPFITGRADWHRADVPIDVFDDAGTVIGQFAGFGALYRFWVESLVSETVSKTGSERAIVVCEAKQVGELLAEGPRSYLLVHTVHNAHTMPPYAWDSPLDDLWGGWFDHIDEMDAVIWLTEAQRADAVRRFGEHPDWIVVPHPAEAIAGPTASAERDLHRVVMLARLVEQKRVEDAIEAWPALLERVPDARLDIYGDGPLRVALASRLSQLGLEERVVLHGHVPNAVDQLQTAGALLLTSRHEGQPLVILEALARACPVIAYDVNYGPADMIDDGRSGILVEAGDVGALVAALTAVIGDRERNAAMSAAALNWARAHSPRVPMALMADLFLELLATDRQPNAPVGATRTN
jgi:poly(glycerol-phosphate) alpha-glucosyltransferase